LIVAARRDDRNLLKVEKDRRQAAFLIEVLAQDRPDELRDAYEDALSRGPKWRSRIHESLEKMARARDLLDAVSS
jgi:hypothetical protein